MVFLTKRSRFILPVETDGSIRFGDFDEAVAETLEFTALTLSDVGSQTGTAIFFVHFLSSNFETSWEHFLTERSPEGRRSRETWLLPHHQRPSCRWRTGIFIPLFFQILSFIFLETIEYWVSREQCLCLYLLPLLIFFHSSRSSLSPIKMRLYKNSALFLLIFLLTRQNWFFLSTPSKNSFLKVSLKAKLSACVGK